MSNPTPATEATSQKPPRKSWGRRLVRLGVFVVVLALIWQLPFVRSLFVSCAGMFGESAAPVYVWGLHDSSRLVRTEANRQLQKLAPKVPEAIPSLIEVMRSPDPGVDELTSLPFHTATTLSQYEEQAAPTVAGLLADNDVTVRRQAARALAEMDSPGSTIKPELEKALGDPDSLVRVRVLHTYFVAGGDAKQVSTQLLQEIDTATDNAQFLAAAYLGEMGKAGVDAIPRLGQWVEAKDKRNRKLAAIQALGKFGPLVEGDARKALEQATYDSDKQIAEEATKAWDLVYTKEQRKFDEERQQQQFNLPDLPSRR